MADYGGFAHFDSIFARLGLRIGTRDSSKRAGEHRVNPPYQGASPNAGATYPQAIPVNPQRSGSVCCALVDGKNLADLGPAALLR